MIQLTERLRRQETMRTVLELGEWLTAAQVNARQKRPPCRRSQPYSTPSNFAVKTPSGSNRSV
ncbi:hypothetical protein [Paraburkholderia youngii]|uniref:Uncharacterized protein n=1 Tax=Paraburkholderia youngii TaxID=2782701 RepID=A0A7Y6JVJ7_9BURK|nr:hypothetical protein [Paraburkholderia youngii]NUX99530.1 hypothetical protein [Paraburkholderia youngii]